MLPNLPAHEVAPQLLGWRLRHLSDAGVVEVRITEVEAYEGADDPASHSYRGPTARNATMFGPAGHLYVYRSYGVHWAGNIVVGPAGSPSGVLLRAGTVVNGLALARDRRAMRLDRPDHHLARGPGNLGQALGLDAGFDGEPLDGSARLLLVRASLGADESVVVGPRVGVSLAHTLPWRFWIDGDPSVSAYRRSPRAPAEE